MFKAYKYCILPTEEQKTQFSQIFGSVRFVYNLALETKITAYKHYKKNIDSFELINQVVDLKGYVEWLKECPSQVLQQTIRNMDSAYSSFFKGGGFPKFKSKKGKQSCQFPQGVKVDFEKGKIYLPKIKWIDCVFSREFNGVIKTVTVSRVPSGKFFVSILVDDGQPKPIKKPIKYDTAVGIDLGIKNFATFSNGATLANHKFLSRTLKRLRIEQRTLSRRFVKDAKEQSKRYHKQKLLVAKLYEKVTNQRRDFLHKMSTQIINEYDTVCLETLNTKGMMQNGNLSRSIGEMGWYDFKTMLEYKSEWHGKNIISIGRFEPSSKTCNICGSYNKDLNLKDRIWTCENGHILDRDKNAALNILNFAIKSINAKPVLT